MRTNKERYLEEINNNPEYKISVARFQKWLAENNEYSDFQHSLHLVAIGDWDIYDLALDYSIPIAMVKWFLKIR